METASRIVVGIDGSKESLDALGLARAEAVMRGGQLEVVLAWDYLDQPGFPEKAPFDPHYTHEQAQATVEQFVAAAIADLDPPVIARAVCDHPASALIDAGVGAELLVVGARGTGGFLGLRLGSVSQKVLTHAPCPVLVVRAGAAAADNGSTDSPVVVGVDGSEHARRALRWALHEAALRRAPVLAVHGGMPSTATATGAGAFEQDARSVVDAEIVWARQEAPDQEVDGRAVTTGGPRALIDASSEASLVVVGARGRGGFTGLLLGSVSQQVAHHAECPVVVLRAG